ncbi:MAG: pathogenicity locus [Bacteroidia bacterium]|nr:pathogenicity locus [Bacteroidia bacterium]
MKKEESLNELRQIPGIGKSLAMDLYRLGYKNISSLKGENPELMYVMLNELNGHVNDICVLYTFRCAVYFANTAPKKHNPEKLKWWSWMDKEKVSSKEKHELLLKQFRR